MKCYIVLFSIAAFFLISGCTPAKEHQAAQLDEESQKANIDLILTKWHEDAARAKPAYFEAMASDGIYIGTDASELWTNKEFREWSKSYFEDGDTWDFKATQRNIYLHETGQAAWFDELLDTWMGTCRGSGVLEWKNDTWQIVHYHLAVTVPNEKIKKVIELKNEAKQDSTKLKTDQIQSDTTSNPTK